MNRQPFLAGAFLAVVCLWAVTPSAQQPGKSPSNHAGPAARNGRFELTVESIMRGPRLVGYEPGSLRWSGDSKQVYFEWRRPGEDEAATYAVGRDGGEPRKLTDAERRNAPPASGQWDRSRRRVVFVDAGDIVLLDTVAGSRRQITAPRRPRRALGGRAASRP